MDTENGFDEQDVKTFRVRVSVVADVYITGVEYDEEVLRSIIETGDAELFPVSLKNIHTVTEEKNG